MKYLFKRLFSDSIAFAIANVGNKLVGLLLFPIFLRNMNQVEYADWGMTNTLTLIITYLSMLGTDAALAFYYHDVKTKQEKRGYLTATMVFSCMVCTLYFLVSLGISGPLSRILYESGMKNQWVIPIAILATLGAIIIQHLLAYTRYERRKWFFTFFSMVYVIGSSVLSMYFVVVLKQGLYGVFYGQLLGQGIISIILLILYRREFIFRVPLQYFKNLLQYGFPLLPTLMVFWVMNMVSRPIVYHMVSPEKAAIYEASIRFASVIALLTSPFQLAWRPFSISIKDREDAPRLYGIVARSGLVIGSLAIMCLSFVIEPLVKWVASQNKPEYFEAYQYVWMLSFGTILNVLHLIIGVGLLIHKKTKAISHAFMVAAIVYLLGCLLLTPMFKIWAVCVMNILAYLVIIVLVYWQNQKVYPVDFRFRSMLIYITVYLALMTGITWIQMSQWQHLWLYDLLALFIAIIAVFASGLFSVKQVLNLKKLFRLN
ncbi:lipopolysaccharide biosynthesis protein [Thermoflavimicrobium daqui]|uniref:Uncharacterized protein n=1 Tax=Thermoflavimicrobium daqui TaxID=2137476 RepID=A0A364K5B6_9BACL|nr:oligosaccharide flippase family protein [Thermoflavimicrobium daqui]RAL24574.1 hypothetical protein DL897_09715 [Thermoflavimicrobium daqui]